MKEVVNYIADDGTIFEDEDECRGYERKMAIKSYFGFKVFNYECEEIEPDPEAFDDIYYILTEKDNNFNCFLDKCNENYDVPYSLRDLIRENKGGHFGYDEYGDYYYCIEDEIKKCINVINTMDLAQ